MAFSRAANHFSFATRVGEFVSLFRRGEWILVGLPGEHRRSCSGIALGIVEVDAIVCKCGKNGDIEFPDFRRGLYAGTRGIL